MLMVYSAGSVTHIREWIDKYHHAAEQAGVAVRTYYFCNTSSPTDSEIDHYVLWQFQRLSRSTRMALC